MGNTNLLQEETHTHNLNETLPIRKDLYAVLAELWLWKTVTVQAGYLGPAIQNPPFRLNKTTTDIAGN